MIFFKPIPFEAALQSVKAKLILKTKLSEKQVEAMGPKLRRRALVLAKQENARFASQVKSIVEGILEGKESESGGRATLREWLDSTGYEPDKAGTITDLGSNARLTLIIRTETQMAQGYAEWKQGQTASILALWPAQEFYRAEEREEPREWPERWDAAGGQFFGGGGDYEEGRMIALKSDPIWRAISRFDNAWPPFDFNSGMGIRDVDREEAEELGLIQPGEIVVESNEDFDDAPPFPEDLPDDLRAELERELANAFCPTGPGGGTDNSCGAKQGVTPAHTATAIALKERMEKELMTSDLMFGHCVEYAQEFKKAHPEAEIVATDIWSDRNRENFAPAHTFIKLGKVYLDADRPRGVDDPRKLPFFGGWKGPLDLHIEGETHNKPQIKLSGNERLAANGTREGVIKSWETRKRRQPNTATPAAIHVTKVLTKKYKVSASELNDGYCDAWAGEVKKILPSARIVEGMVDGGGGMPVFHVWIKHGGKHYDAEATSGVSSQHHLPIFRRAAGEADTANAILTAMDEAIDVANAAFDESQHSRDERGRFSASGRFAVKRGMVPIHRIGDAVEPLEEGQKKYTGKWQLDSGGDLPAHIGAVPPAWRDAYVSTNPDDDYETVGLDSKGRVQKFQSEAFAKRQAALKFSRINELMQKKESIFAQNDKNLLGSDKSVVESAACLKLIMATGIRPGSDTDTLAKVKAFGATTLTGSHVATDGNKTFLRFIGKHGVTLDIEVTDKSTETMLRARAKAAGDSGLLFQTTDARLRDYTHTLGGGSFKPKDFRTLKGTSTAIEALKKDSAVAKNMKEFKKRVMAIAKQVASKLGNTPNIALESYISPSVWESIKPKEAL